eukprot:Tamp_14741.p1 GENE.Tamp_14741~~Tamp_14741.p1  ORF type:complete len:461 (-),score=157.96 Tamp_14741:222-1568(-)
MSGGPSDAIEVDSSSEEQERWQTASSGDGSGDDGSEHDAYLHRCRAAAEPSDSDEEDEEDEEDDVVARASRVTRTFMPAETFEGSKEGFVFKMGEKGLGYYFDGPEEEEEADAGDEEAAASSRHARELARRAKEMGELEKANVQDKAWFLQGEVSSTKRPANSLLEVPLDFDHATKQVPVVTQELTDSLEEMIRQRCIDQTWDDPVRKAPSDAKRQKRELEEVVDTEKSSKGLGDIYAAEYARKILGVKDDDVEAAKRQEVEALFAKVCNRLDALSNFHFTPKVVADEIAIKPNVPAIQMEEKIPMGVSEEQVTAPQDVHKPKGKTADLTAEAEMTKEDRNKRRNNKKRRHKENMKKKNASLRAQGLEVPVATSLPTLKGGKVEKGGKGKNKGETGGAGTEVKTGAYAKSSTLFRALQEEALGTIAGWKQGDGDGKKSKKSGGGAFKL